MARGANSDNEKRALAASFRTRVLAAVRRVPRGKVATYGDIAELAGAPRAARAVGNVLLRLSAARSQTVPWHRIVNAAGRITPREYAGLQRELLERETVRFRAGRVDLAKFGWRPKS